MARPNMKRLFASNELKVGHILFEFSTPGIGQILKAADVDFVFVHMEHSGFGISEIKRIVNATPSRLLAQAWVQEIHLWKHYVCLWYSTGYGRGRRQCDQPNFILCCWKTG